MLGIAGDNVVGLGSIGAFVDAIVGPVARNLESFGRMHHPANSTNVDEHGFSLVGLKFQAWTIEDFLVLRKHGRRNAQGKLSLQGKRQDHGFVSFGSDQRGDRRCWYPEPRRSSGGLFRSAGSLTADGGDLCVDLPHGQLVGAPALGGCPNLPQPLWSVFSRLLDELLKLRLASRNSIQDDLRSV